MIDLWYICEVPSLYECMVGWKVCKVYHCLPWAAILGCIALPLQIGGWEDWRSLFCNPTEPWNGILPLLIFGNNIEYKIESRVRNECYFVSVQSKTRGNVLNPCFGSNTLVVTLHLNPRALLFLWRSPVKGAYKSHLAKNQLWRFSVPYFFSFFALCGINTYSINERKKPH